MGLSAEERIDAVAPIAEGMLPPTASPIEKALLAAELAAFAEVDPSVIATIWDPWKCPASLLPWLAWAVSVDVWNPDWSEIEKRREIAASPEIHRIKGTRQAVALTLDRLGLNFEISEWWEATPVRRRGTFKVFVDVADQNTQPVREEVVARVRSSKPKSRFLDLKIGISETGPIGISAGTTTRSTIIAEPFIIDGPAEELGPMGIASATVTRSIITAEAA